MILLCFDVNYEGGEDVVSLYVVKIKLLLCIF